MIFGDDVDFFIQFDVLFNNNPYPLGPLNIWIDGRAYPGKDPTVTLTVNVYNLVEIFFEEILNHPFKGSNISLDKLNFDAYEIFEKKVNDQDLFYWATEGFWDNGLSLMCEIVGDSLRIFYKQDDEPYREKVIPLEYYKNIMIQLDQWLKDGYPKQNN